MRAITDYNLGRASGKIEIDYDGSGASKAIVDLDKVTGANEKMDASLSKSQRTLGDTSAEMQRAGTSADGYNRRLQDVRKTADEVDKAEKDYKKTLLDSSRTLHDVEVAQERVTNARKDHTKAVSAERDAHRALGAEMSSGQRAMRAMGDLIPNLERNLSRLSTTTDDAARKSNLLARGLGDVGKAIRLLGPEANAVAGGLTLASRAVDRIGSSSKASGEHVRNFVKDLAGFEVGFGKIAGLSLGIPALGGLGAIGGAAGVQGIVNMADAVRQLSGAMALLPAAVGGGALVMGTMKVALHGVGDALKDMMADDPKKFLEDIKNMAPASAHAMLQVAQFRDAFKLGGAAVQTSFFDQINKDIQPLIQTWLPALVAGGSKIAGVMGQAADAFAKLMMQPQMLAAFSAFVDNISKGLQALQPAMKPLLDIFTQLAVVGSSMFQAIGGQLTTMLNFFDQVVSKAAADGSLQRFMTEGVNAIFHVINALYSFGAAFNHIMDIAERFGGGGLLGWIDKLGQQLNTWTQSAAGQKALTDFFTTLRQATDAFLPMLGPMLQGIMSIGTAFVQLGVATAPAWLEFFKTFAYEMAHDLGPAIVGMGPAISTFLTGMTDAFRQMMQTIGPQLPQIFQELANAFIALLPQLPQLAALFINLMESVGPQLPQLFRDVDDVLKDLIPLMPTIIGFFRDFVSIVNLLVNIGGGAVEAITGIAKAVQAAGDWIGKLPETLGHIADRIDDVFKDLPHKAEDWGKSILDGLARGLGDSFGLSNVERGAKTILDGLSDWFPHSPAKKGPFSGSGYTLTRGQTMIADLAAGMAAAQPAVVAAAASVTGAASRALGVGGRAGGGAAAGGGGGAPSAGGAGTEGGSLQPDWIRNADVSILDRYLQHEPDKNRGLAGFAADMGKMLKVAQDGSNLLFQHMLQPLGQFLSLKTGKDSFLFPALNAERWRKMDPQQAQEQAMQELQRKALEGKAPGPSWGDVLGTAPGAAGQLNPAAPGQQIPLGLSSSSSPQDIQKGIIAAGRARGLNDAQIQTMLAVASAESGFNPTISGGVQGSAGLVSGLFQQSPSSGWGTLAQVNDPNYAINKFLDAYQAQLSKNPTDPMLAAVLTQNPQLGSGAKGSAYWNAVAAKQAQAGQILSTIGPGVKGPTWQNITGGGPPGVAPSGAPAPAAPGGTAVELRDQNGKLIGTVPAGTPNATQFRDQGGNILATVPPTTAAPPAAGTAGPGGVGLNPASRATQVPNAPNVEAGIGKIGGLGSKLYPTSGPGAYQVPGWANQLAAAFGLTASTYATGGSLHQMGYAFDFNDPNSPNGSSAKLDAFADFIAKNLGPQTLQLIHASGNRRWGIASGQDVSQGGYYAGDYGGHYDHVHFATDVPVLLNGQLPPGSLIPTGTTPGAMSPQAAAAAAAGYPDVAGALGQIQDNTGKSLSVNDKLLNAYLQGNPALASQIDAARQSGASDQQVQSTLDNISTTITGLKSQDAVGNKNTIDALQSAQRDIAQGAGFQQQQSPAQMFQSIAGGAGTIASSIIQAVQGGLDALTATQDIADRLVYGVRNTEDVNKLIDDFQKYITEAANIANAVGSILSAAGSMSGGGDMGGAAAAGQAAQLIAGLLQGINAGIDFAQQIYELAGSYVGRFLSTITGLAGVPLSGDVHLELNKRTGQLIGYSQDNPENKDYMNVPSWMNQLYDYQGGGNQNPQRNNQFNIYGGPGQSAGQLLNESMWMVGTSGTQGAMAASNF